MRCPCADGAGEQGGDLGFGARKLSASGVVTLKVTLTPPVPVGAHAETAVGTAGEWQDGLGAALAGEADATALQREGDRGLAITPPLANGTGKP